MSLLDTFFGRNKSASPPHKPDMSPAPSRQPAATPVAPSAAAVAPEPSVDPDALVFRQEIVDTKRRLCGYRFMPVSMISNRVVPEPQFIEALQELRVTEFAQRRRAVVPISPDCVVFGRHQALVAPQLHLMLDVRRAGLPPQELLGRLSTLREAGCKTALTGVSLVPEQMALMQATDLLFLPLSEMPFRELQSTAHHLHTSYPHLQLAAEQVHSWAEQRACASWGFEYCMGDFLTQSDEDGAEEELSESRIATIELLNSLRREADLAELTAVAKRDPGISFHLLQWANSPAVGLAKTVTTLGQAIMVLGREQLYRWLTVSMFRMGKQRERDEALLEVALTRARFLETIGDRGLSKEQREELFLVGLLSLFDVLLRMPMQKILSRIQLSEAESDVLLRSSGPYCHYLMLALAMEKGRVQQVATLAQGLGLETERLDRTHREAFSWAQEALSAA